MSVETEIKLQFLSQLSDRAVRSGIQQAVAADIPRAMTRRLRSVYFDTPDNELAARGVTVRLRGTDSHWVQTVKSPANGKIGLQTYVENEVVLPEERLHLSLLPKRTPHLKWLVTEQDNLRPVFETDIQRTAWQIGVGQGKVELAWDRGHIRANAQAQPVIEIELELKEGDPAILFDLARALTQAMPVRLGYATKAQRGMRLAAGKASTAQSAGNCRLSSDDSVTGAFHKIADQCLSQMRANESALLVGGAPDAVHQFRVALRRLRAATGIYRNLIDEETYFRWRQELKWVHQAFGRVRDLDVFISRTMDRLAKHYQAEPGLASITDIAKNARKLALAAALDAINSRRYALMLIDISSRFSRGTWKRQSAEASLEMAATEFARKQLQKRYKRVRRIGDRWPDLEIGDLHRLRILVKKLRYLALAFGSLFPVKSTREFFASLESLQDCLGRLNDNAVGQQYASELAATTEGAGPEKSGFGRALSIISGWHSRGIQDSQEDFEMCWQVFVKGQCFWKR